MLLPMSAAVLTACASWPRPTELVGWWCCRAKTVFELTWDAGPDCDLICPVSVDGEGCCSFCDKGELCIYERKCRQEHIEQIGKTVFLTREEAEAALEAKRDGSTSM